MPIDTGNAAEGLLALKDGKFVTLARAVSAGVLHEVDGWPHRRPQCRLEGPRRLDDGVDASAVPHGDRQRDDEQGDEVPAASGAAREVGVPSARPACRCFTVRVEVGTDAGGGLGAMWSSVSQLRVRAQADPRHRALARWPRDSRGPAAVRTSSGRKCPAGSPWSTQTHASDLSGTAASTFAYNRAMKFTGLTAVLLAGVAGAGLLYAQGGLSRRVANLQRRCSGAALFAAHQINTTNISTLKLAWQYGVAGAGPGSTGRAAPSQAMPILVRGVLYTSTTQRTIVALDPVTGRELWKHELRRAAPRIEACRTGPAMPSSSRESWREPPTVV